MAAQFKERIERVVLICAGVSLEDKDMEEGLFKHGRDGGDSVSSISGDATAGSPVSLLQTTKWNPFLLCQGLH